MSKNSMKKLLSIDQIAFTILRITTDAIKDYKRVIGIALLSSVWMGIAASFYKLITTKISVFWFEVYNLFDCNYLLNIPICFCLVVICVLLCKKIKSRKIIRIRYVLQIAFVFLLLYYQSPFMFARIVWIIDYRLFMTLLLAIVLLIICLRLLSDSKLSPESLYGLQLYRYDSRKMRKETRIDYRMIRKESDPPSLVRLFSIPFIYFFLIFELLFDLIYGFKYYLKRLIDLLPERKERKEDYSEYNKIAGFSADNEKIEHPISLKQYAQSIVNRLLATDIKEESFAVGITSEWGAGKTTFLHLLQETIGDSANIVEFNPWMCRTPEQVTSDFFSSLRHQLSECYPALSRPIKQYAKHIDSISFPASKLFSLELSNIADTNDLFRRKKELSKKFSQLDKPVVVIIDDIDRLERNEVFEVLRLIRNTADLSNVIYLVAYDKDYVVSVLNEKRSVEEAANYLEKIFQLEIQLPMVPEDMIWSTLLDEFAKQVFFEPTFDNEDKRLILLILSTYRRVKRFSRLFSLNYSYLQRRETSVDLVWRDVFWLDMLQVYDKRIYDTLCNNPERILEKHDNLWIYLKNKDSKILIDGKEKNIDSNTHEILIRLFYHTADSAIDYYSICHLEHYNKYFTMQVQFSDEDINRLVNTEDVDALVAKWSANGKNNLYYILSIMRKYDTTNLDNVGMRNYLRGIMSLSYYKLEVSLYEEIRYITDFFPDNTSKDQLFDWISEWIHDKLESSGNEAHHKALSNIVGAIDCSKFGLDKVKKLIVLILQNYFDNEKGNPVLDLLNPYSTIGHILNNSYRLYGSENRPYVFNYIVDTLSQKAKKPTLKEFEKAYDKAIDELRYSPIDRGLGISQEELNVIKAKCIAH